MRIGIFLIVFILAFWPILMFGNDRFVINEDFRNTPLREVLHTLKDNYQLKIAFSDKFVRDIEINTLVNNLNVHDAFNKILESTGLTFELIDDNTVIIKRRKKNEIEKPSSFVLSGVVSDANTGESLPYAYVWVEPDNKNILTNVEGYFSIPNANSSTQLRVSYLEYNDTLVTITDQYQKRRLHIHLKPRLVELEEVVVSSEVDNFKAEIQAGKITMNPKMALRTPSNGEADVFRALQLLPGVNATNEVSSSLNINGGTSNQNLVLFDGFTVYHVDHFFGYLSAFNPVAIKSLRLYKGGFPSKYGGRVSSVVDISGKDGNRYKTSGSLGLNLLSVNTTLEVPLSNNGTTLFFSGRRSYTDKLGSSLFNNIFDIFKSSIIEDPLGARQPRSRTTESELVPNFYYSDLNLKFSTKVGPKNHLWFSFYNSKDVLNYSQSTQSNFRDTLNVATEDLGFIEWGNIGSSLNLSRQWNSKHYSNMLFSYSFYESDFKKQSNSINRSATLGKFETNASQDQYNNIEDLTFKFDHEWELSNSNKLETGLLTSLYSNQFGYEADGLVLVDKIEDNKWLFSHYLQGTFSLNSAFSLSPGIRSSYFTTTDKLYFEPRLSFNYRLNEFFQFKGATGLYYQFINQSNTKNVLEGSRDFWILANDTNVPVQRSWHGLLGFEYNKAGATISLNYFQKEFDGLLEYAFKNGALLSQFEEENRIFAVGKGSSKGVEFMVKKDFGKFSSWASYTIGQVIHRFPKINDGKSFFADHDQRHEFNWLGIYRLNRFEFSATWIYGSGKPYSLVRGVETRNSSDNRGPAISFLKVTDRNVLRLPTYHRLDISAKYTFNLDKAKANIALSVFNLYNRENFLDTRVSVLAPRDSRNRRDPIINTSMVPLLGITSNLSFGIEF
ncbi:carboxypeptidase-like regulatory domain-containing protein [Xanthovirga aplysinae]|uniref:carboxypeptidase-like regulatory domain-containing protein n=1 Tax=Xanthovirga aplysinae TaxID=2529853 RepID=UPI0012BCE732|nr:carboxypeptidase-like regulatory domain-containing protein [Xanthovirga aplysinae]MTI32766.1 hypothetical protein [Xanthovirga aplysinae]